MMNVEKARSTTTKPESTFKKMLNAFGDSLSNHASSADEEDGEDEDEDEADTKLGKLSEDDELGWVMGTISSTVQTLMESFGQMEMTLEELKKPGWRDTADYFRGREMKYGTTELKVPSVMKP